MRKCREKTFPKRPQVTKQRLECLERGEAYSTEAAERGSNWLGPPAKEENLYKERAVAILNS